MNKTYILLKDLPDSKAGDRYEWRGELPFSIEAYYKNGDVQESYWTKEMVENNPEWFKEEAQSNDSFQRVLKTLKGNKVMVDTRGDGIYVRLAGNEDKGEAFTLHWANVYPINNQLKPQAENKPDMVGDIVTPPQPQKEEQRTYTQSQVDSMLEDAFKKARETSYPEIVRSGQKSWRYKTFQDYKNTQP